MKLLDTSEAQVRVVVTVRHWRWYQIAAEGPTRGNLELFYGRDKLMFVDFGSQHLPVTCS